MSRRITPLAAAALAALAGINVWLLTIIFAAASGEEAQPVAAPAWEAKLSASGRDGTAAKPIGTYRQTLAQPVFFKSREPYVAPPPPPPTPPTPAAMPKAPAPVVVDPGLTVGQGVRKAYLQGKSDPHGSWVSEGETLTGWKVQAIGADGVKLQQQDHTIELQLYPAPSEDHAPPSPSPPGMAGPPPFMQVIPPRPVAGR